MDDRLLRADDVARFLGVSKSRAYELMADGTLPVVRIGRSVRVSRQSLERWLSECEATPHDPVIRLDIDALLAKSETKKPSGRVVSIDHIRDVDAMNLAGVERRIVRILRAEGGSASRSVILNRLRNVPADTITRVLGGMERVGIVSYSIIETTTKPEERWSLSA